MENPVTPVTPTTESLPTPVSSEVTSAPVAPVTSDVMPSSTIAPLDPTLTVDEADKKKKKMMMLIIALFLLIVAIAIAAFLLLSKNQTPVVNNTVTPTPTPVVSKPVVTTPAPTPTPTSVTPPAQVEEANPDQVTTTDYRNDVANYYLTIPDTWTSKCGSYGCTGVASIGDNAPSFYLSDTVYFTADSMRTYYDPNQSWDAQKQILINDAEANGRTHEIINTAKGVEMLKITWPAADGVLRVDYYVKDARPSMYLDIISYDNASGSNQAALNGVILTFRLK